MSKNVQHFWGLFILFRRVPKSEKSFKSAPKTTKINNSRISTTTIEYILICPKKRKVAGRAS